VVEGVVDGEAHLEGGTVVTVSCASRGSSGVGDYLRRSRQAA
jgi:hypothetical protein